MSTIEINRARLDPYLDMQIQGSPEISVLFCYVLTDPTRSPRAERILTDKYLLAPLPAIPGLFYGSLDIEKLAILSRKSRLVLLISGFYDPEEFQSRINRRLPINPDGSP